MRCVLIIPSHNRAGNLDCVLASLTQQTVKPHELVIVDDRFGDNTRDVVFSYPELKAKYVYNPPTHSDWSASIPRNLGAKVAARDTDLFWFLDSDVMRVEETIQAYEKGFPHVLPKQIFFMAGRVRS